MNAPPVSQRAVTTLALAVLVFAGVLVCISPPHREKYRTQIPVVPVVQSQPKLEPIPDETDLISAEVWQALRERKTGFRSVPLVLHPLPAAQALNEDNGVGCKLTDYTLKEIIALLTVLNNTNIVFDKSAQVVADNSLYISVDLSNLTLRDALCKLLKPLKLRYVIKGNDLVITTIREEKIDLGLPGLTSNPYMPYQPYNIYEWLADSQIEILLLTVSPVLAQRSISDIKPPVNVKQAYFGPISPEWPGHFLLIEQGKKLRVWTCGFFSLGYRNPSDKYLLWMPAENVTQKKRRVTFFVFWGCVGKGLPLTWDMELPEEFKGEEIIVTVDTDTFDHKPATIVLRRVKEDQLGGPKK